MSDATSPTLSVVVVTRNEAANVDDCLGSILDLCEDGPDHELILVDSNSSDDSTTRAANYPVTVLRIPRDDLASPGAGRYVGTQYAEGDYILFVDGDMRLTTGWLDDAMELVQQAGTAGVSGALADPDAGPGTEVLADESPTIDTTDLHPVEALRGVALYDAAALDEVGGFDPHLQASEDVDVGYRLRAAGYRLHRLPVVVATHPDTGSLVDPIRRWRRGYFHGVGQAVRKGAEHPGILARHVATLRHPLLGAVWGALGLTLAARSRRARLAWTLLTLSGLTAYATQTGVRRTLADSCSYTLTVVGLLLGSRRPPPPPEEYPIDQVELVHDDPDRA